MSMTKRRSVQAIATALVQPLGLLGSDEAAAVKAVAKALRAERAQADESAKARDFFADLFRAARAAGEVHFECSGCGWIANPQDLGKLCRKCSGTCIAVSTKDHPAKVEASNWQARALAAERALADALPFLPDVNGTAPAVTDWHVKHGPVIRSAAEQFGTDKVLSNHPCYTELTCHAPESQTSYAIKELMLALRQIQLENHRLACAITADTVRVALQDAWNDWTADTGAYPDCFIVTRGPRLTADFSRCGNFASSVAIEINGTHARKAQQTVLETKPLQHLVGSTLLMILDTKGMVIADGDFADNDEQQIIIVATKDTARGKIALSRLSHALQIANSDGDGT